MRHFNDEGNTHDLAHGYGVKRTLLAATILGALMGGASSSALAQNATMVTSASRLQVEEIVVTARRRAETAQRVPIALTALGSAQVEQAGTAGLTQIQQQVPSLQLTVTNARNTNINIRGLGASTAFSNLGLEYGVGVYVDQVYFSRPGQSAFELFDVERLEVLRGPQGTLFGKNTTAGAINITTQAPSFDPELRAELTAGNYNYLQARASGTMPVVDDKLAVRLSVSDTIRDKGFLRNVRNGERMNDYRNFGARGQILWAPVEDIRVRLIGDYAQARQECCIGTNYDVVTTRIDGSPLPNNFYVRAARAGYTPLPNRPYDRRLDLDTEASLKSISRGLTGIVDWDFAGHTLTSVTAWRDWTYRPETDADVIGLSILPQAGVDEDQRQFSQELRLASTGERTIDYVLGLYYFQQTIEDDLFVVYGPDAALWILGNAGRAQQAALNGLFADGHAKAKTRSYAAFGQGTWRIADPLSLTVGLRYTHEKKTGHFDQTQRGPALATMGLSPIELATAQALRNVFAPNVSYDSRTSENNLSGLATLAFQATPDVMAYATYARGFKSGGLNLTTLPAGVSAVVDPEKVNHYELGLKSQLFDRRLVFNAAAFWTEISDYQNAQINTAVANTAYIDNVGKVRTRGIELDARARLAEGLNLYASGVYVDATYRDYANAPCPIEYLGLQSVCDLSGRRLPGTSKYSASAGGEYAFPVSDTRELYFGADYSYRSSFYSTFNLAAASLVSGYGITNARLGLRHADGDWDMSLWVRNAFDTNYPQILNFSAFNTGLLTAQTGDPRTFGITLRGLIR